MDSQPLVSICCLTYNHAPFIRECLESFLMQECTFAFEVLIHDDASSDGTKEIIEKYEARFPNIIKPIYQTENQFSKGVGVTRVYNFPRAKGKYIAMCEGDDYWTDKKKLQKQFDVMESNSEFSLCSHDFLIKYEHKKIPNRRSTEIFNYLTQSPVGKQNLYSISLKDFCIHLDGLHTATNFFRTSIIKEHFYDNYTRVISGDYLIKLILLKEGNAVFINECMSVLRKNAGGMTQQKKDSLVSFKMQKHQLSLFAQIAPKGVKKYFYRRLWKIYPNYILGRGYNVPVKDRVNAIVPFFISLIKSI